MSKTQRGIVTALVMGAVPLLHVFLFWKLCNEAKVRWKLAGLNSTLYAAALLIPVLNIYPLYQFLVLVSSNLEKEGKKGYGLPPLALSIAASVWPLALMPLVCPIVLLLAWLAWLYIIYRTQSLFNENGVETL